MTLLAFETSCDETSVAVIRNGRILANDVSSQVRLHSEYGGVVPELAARAHLENLLPVTCTALAQAGVHTSQLDAVAATQGPGLPGALMVGFKAAQAVAFAMRRPFLGVNHHEAHLYSPWVDETTLTADFSQFQPNVSLIVSGGHTLLVHVRADLDHTMLGTTLDDAAGECFDKTGKLMGLPYPAGPEIDRLAESGNPAAFKFPRPMISENHDDFSFSGLKTSVRYFLQDHPGILRDEAQMRDLCASIQNAIVEVLVTKTIRAARRLRVRCVTASGGVTCNSRLRSELALSCDREGMILHLAPRGLCTDNAAMIGILAERRLSRDSAGTPLSSDIRADWSLDERA